MKRSIFFLLVFIFILSFSLSSAFSQDTTTFPYLKPPNHLSPRYVIKLADGELIRSATSREDMQTLVGSLFGADTYFKDLNSSVSRKELYKQVLREIVLMNVLEQDRKWLSYLTAVSEGSQLPLELLDPELMGDFFSLYRTLINNRYILDNSVLSHSLNYLKQFGRMDTQISRTWWQAIDKLKLHQHTLDQVGKGLSFASFIASVGSITLSAMEAMNQEIATVHLTLIAKTLEDMEGQGEYFSLAFKQALKELIQENDSSFIAEFTHNLYYEWEKNKDKVTEKGLALFMQTTGKKAITTTLQKAGLSHAALPALAWSLSIQYSYHVIQSGLKGIDLFHRYVMTTDTLFYLRKMRNYAYANQQTADYLSFNLLDATSQLYAYQLLEALMNITPQKLMFWKLGARKLVLAEIASTQEELKSLFPESLMPPEPPEKPKMITWEKTFGGSAYDMANDIIQTIDGGYAVAGYTLSKVDGEKDEDAWVVKLDNQGNLLWDNTFGGSDWDEANSIIQTIDGGYLVAGGTASKGVGKFDVWIVKLNSQGNLLWDKTFGGSGDYNPMSIVQTKDGSYVIAGIPFSSNPRGVGFWIIKLDEQGNIIWDKNFKEKSYVAWISFIQTSDGGYAVTRTTISHYVWFIKLDEQGNIIWDKIFGGIAKAKPYCLIQTRDGGYALTGITYSKGAGNVDAWLLRLDSQGNLLWDQTYGGSSTDLANSLIQNNDGGYALTGITYSKGAGNADAWILKLDKQGNLVKEKETSKFEDSSQPSYALGDNGPAGGIVFYDKGSYSDGWRYLEVAPASTEWEDEEWGSYETWIGGTGTGIGTGKSNTAKIVKWLNSHSERDRAAQLCDALDYGGYKDWFLPSKDELNLMYENLCLEGVGGFVDNYYWSSSEYDAYWSWNQGFCSGSQCRNHKELNLGIRAIRAF